MGASLYCSRYRSKRLPTSVAKRRGEGMKISSLSLLFFVSIFDSVLNGQAVGFGHGFSVRVKMSKWDPNGRVGEYGWGGAASTHYWISPKDNLIVLTLEQVMPYSFNTEWALKGLIYDALVD